MGRGGKGAAPNKRLGMLRQSAAAAAAVDDGGGKKGGLRKTREEGACNFFIGN